MTDAPTLVHLLHRHAAAAGEANAYRFLTERGEVQAALSFAALRTQALRFAATARARGARPGERVLLVFAPGLEFLVAFFGCLVGGFVAVPMLPPRRVGARDASDSIVADCGARFAATTARLLADQRTDLGLRLAAQGLACLAVDEMDAAEADDFPLPAADDLAFLQYTSGSTAAPKGVMVRHANLMANLAMIQAAFGTRGPATTVSWVPLHHDMGLVLNALQAFHCGGSCVLMAPVAFLQRPLSWLRAIHEFRAEIAGGPNFAYDLCAARLRPEQVEGLDLSGWRVAFNGAEPVAAATLRRFAAAFAPFGFRAESLYPCYGMAEATLLISGGTRGAGATVAPVSRAALGTGRVAAPAGPGDTAEAVGCGRPVQGSRIAIVDPDGLRRTAPDAVGEIWVAGAHVAAGYWRNAAATQEGFAAEISGEPGQTWLRTGDLGFCDPTGELFIAGRLKDLVIVRGVNHYPQDIERTAQAVAPALRPGHGAAFAIDHASGERLVLVQEIERSSRQGIAPDALVAAIREAIVETHEIAVHEIVLVMPGTIPKTTSGKIQRRLTRRLWEENRLSRFAPPWSMSRKS